MSAADPGIDGTRGIGLRSAAGLVAANMIGAGVFTTSGFALADLGDPAVVLVAWAVGGGIALCGALCYARLAVVMPENGGEYVFLSRAVHPLAGFLAGWVSLFAGFTAPIAVAAHGLEAYAGAALGADLPPRLLGATAIVLCGVLHASTRSGGLRLQDWAVGVKVTAIGLFVLLGIGRLALGGPLESAGAAGALPIAADLPVLPEPSIGAFAVTLVWISFAYSGWNAAVYVAGEVAAPERTLPRALGLATLGVVGLYLALNAVFLGAAAPEALAGRAEVGAVAAEALAGEGGRALLAGIVALALFTSVSAMVMVGPRVYAQMATDGVLPRFLAPTHLEPRAAIALQVGLALLAFQVAGLRALLDYVGFLLGLSAAGTVACLFLPHLRRNPAARVPGGFVVPAVFIAMTLGSSAFLLLREPRSALVALATLVAGVVVYALQRRAAG